MKSRPKYLAMIALLGIVLLAACASKAAPTQMPYTDGLTAPKSGERAAMESGAPAPMPTQIAPAAQADTNSGAGSANVDMDVLAASYRSNRKIIKNAEVKLQVEDTDVAIDRATQIVADVGGYIISSRVWYQDYLDKSYKYTTITIGVPVDQFERSLRRLRDLSLKVLDENATGQDVTDQYVDLQSQLDNLIATRDRIRAFLDQAQNVDEALRVNQQLAEVESQIEEIQGRMNYLSDRSAFSTITINMEPKLPEFTPTPTPTPAPWSLQGTVDDATGTLTTAYQGLMEVMVWVVLVIVPIIAPFALVFWALWRLATRKKVAPQSEPASD